MDARTERGSIASSKRALLVLSHAMERAYADDVDDRPGLIIGLFQRREYFDAEADRYAQLAAAGHVIVVGFAGSGEGLPQGVHAVVFSENDERAETWVLMLVRGVIASSLIARDSRDLAVGESTLEASRLFQAWWTLRRPTALSEAWAQLADLARDLPPEVVAAATAILQRSRAEPESRGEARIASIADHLSAAIEVGERRAARLRTALEVTQALAERDQLTGLNNRHHLERFLGYDDRPASMLASLVDVDDLKAINDTWGHAAGDAVLQAVAKALRDNSRPNDVVIRWGGDEFLILVPGSVHELGLQVGQRLADAVHAAIPQPPWEHVAVSASIGVCWTRNTGLPLEQLDAALKDVKGSGKGTVAMAAECVLRN